MLNPPVTRRSGFSLIELLVVLAVLALLASMGLPLAEITVQRDKEHELQQALWEIRDAIDAYKLAKERGALQDGRSSAYPPSLEVLTHTFKDARDGQSGRVMRFLRRVPRDPFADTALAAEETWGLRCFQSELNDPRPGEDVYDVYSRSDRKALNGTQLRSW